MESYTPLLISPEHHHPVADAYHHTCYLQTGDYYGLVNYCALIHQLLCGSWSISTAGKEVKLLCQNNINIA